MYVCMHVVPGEILFFLDARLARGERNVSIVLYSQEERRRVSFKFLLFCNLLLFVGSCFWAQIYIIILSTCACESPSVGGLRAVSVCVFSIWLQWRTVSVCKHTWSIHMRWCGRINVCISVASFCCSDEATGTSRRRRTRQSKKTVKKVFEQYHCYRKFIYKAQKLTAFGNIRRRLSKLGGRQKKDKLHIVCVYNCHLGT